MRQQTSQQLIDLAGSRTGWPYEFEGNADWGAEDWPRISIITPSYNQGAFLEETLRSVILQGYPNLEYIVIDGGSTDNSVDIIQQYAHWITHWVSEKDRGQSHAINKGFARATGDILAWLNSDDVYAPNALRIAAEALRDKHKGLLIGVSIITDNPYRLEGRLDKRRPSWNEIVYEARTFPQPSVFWTRDLWEAAGPISEDLYFVMDYELWVKMYPHTKHRIETDTVLSYARTHPAQKSQEQATEAFGFQRANVVLREAHRRGESAVTWALKAWWRQVGLAIKHRHLSRLRGTSIQRDVLRLAFKRKQHKP